MYNVECGKGNVEFLRYHNLLIDGCENKVVMNGYTSKY